MPTSLAAGAALEVAAARIDGNAARADF